MSGMLVALVTSNVAMPEIQGKIAGDMMVELQPQLTHADLTKIRHYMVTWGSMRLANALRLAGRLEEARCQAQSLCRQDGRLYMACVVMASTLVELGRPAEARQSTIDARRIRPTLTLSEIGRFFG